MRQTNISLIPKDFDPKRQLAVSLSNEPIPRETFPWSETFTHVDFIVSTSQTIKVIKDNGTERNSSDINGIYNSADGFFPYLAANIKFIYFLNKTRASLRSIDSLTNETDEYFINFIIGNSGCPTNLSMNCQNGPLKPNFNYLYDNYKVSFCIYLIFVYSLVPLNFLSNFIMII